MRTITNDFKNALKQIKEVDSIVTYTINNVEYELSSEQLNSIQPHYEGDILKSVMKQLDLDSNVDIAKGTIFNLQVGIKVRNDEIDDSIPNNYRINYDYINYGNYIVYSSEKQEDTNSYLIKCYDKMLYAMKDYENLGITYPITIQNYLGAICTHLGLTLKSSNFTNYNKTINSELYLDAQGNSLGYTFRDVLDEIAQATASTICINEDDDELEVRYITQTNDVVDEEFFDENNVNFGETYGPVNTITFKRSADSDVISVSYPEDLPDDEKIEISISDNQILNGNNRDEYIDNILNRLLGLTYITNDYSSKGILYYNLCDRYTASIFGTTYNCVMLDDDVTIENGVKENVFTEMPKISETDYTKADKTDRKINQTYLIVDKQNQTIESVVSQTIDTTNPDSAVNKVSRLTQRVDSLESEISNVTGMVATKDSTSGSITFTDETNESEPITIKVYPTSESISYLYPRSNLYPSSTTYLKNRKIRFYNNTTSQVVYDYELPDDLLYYDSTHYDEFYLDLNSQTCQVIKRCKYNADGTIGLLTNEQTDNYTYPLIPLTEGAYTISLLGYNAGYILTTLMAKNIYTDQFYTKVETDSKISQTSQSINLSVNQKLSNYSTTNEMNSAISLKANEITSTVNNTLSNYSTTTQMNSAINQKADEITSEVSETYETIDNANNKYATKTTTNALSSRISQTAKNITLSVENGSTSSGITIGITKEDGTSTQATGTIQMNGLVKFTDLSTSGATTINGANIQTGTLSASQITTGTLNGNNVEITNLNASNINAGTLNGKNVNITNLSASNITGGTLSANKISGGTMKGSSLTLNSSNAITLNGSDGKVDVKIENEGVKFYDNSGTYAGLVTSVNTGATRGVGIGTHSGNRLSLYKDSSSNEIAYFNAGNGVHAYSFHNISLASEKKNITPFEDDAIKIINGTDVYSFVYKKDKSNQEHIGFVIGDEYRTSKKIADDKGVDIYSVCGIMWKAIQEQQKQIEDLQNEIKKIKKESDK